MLLPGGALPGVALGHLLDEAARDVDGGDQRARFRRHFVGPVMERHRLDDRERDAPQAK